MSLDEDIDLYEIKPVDLIPIIGLATHGSRHDDHPDHTDINMESFFLYGYNAAVIASTYLYYNHIHPLYLEMIGF